MKIFWSWQSDTPGKIGRHFVRDALKAAIEQLKQAPDIEDAEREAMHLDHDVQNVPGSPDLARTIFNKIDQSAVFIADVTAVGRVSDGNEAKKLINSNVGIELGYALKSLGDTRVLFAFNKHYGDYSDLPFDLRHKGKAVTFELAPDASAAQIKSEGAKLQSRFEAALRLMAATTKQSESFIETEFTYSRACYFTEGEALAEFKRSHQPVVCFYRAESLGYMRLIPAKPLSPPIRLTDLKAAARNAPFFRKHSVWLNTTALAPSGLRPICTTLLPRQLSHRRNFSPMVRFGRFARRSYCEKSWRTIKLIVHLYQH